MYAHIPSYTAQKRVEWRYWLEKHHHDTRAIWLVFKKKTKGGTLSYDDIVEEALCFGWIDSIAGKVDDEYTKLYLSKRKPTSVWSKINKIRIDTLREKGLMTPAGEAVITVAQNNGSWDALQLSDSLILTPILQEVLKDPEFKKNATKKQIPRNE